MIEKKIDIPIFNAQVLLLKGDHIDVECWVNKRFKEANFQNSVYQYGQFLRIDTGEDIFMCIFLYPGSTEEHIYHESLHAAYDILNTLGIDVTPENHEVLAFLMGYIANRILEEIKE